MTQPPANPSDEPDEGSAAEPAGDRSTAGGGAPESAGRPSWSPLPPAPPSYGQPPHQSGQPHGASYGQQPGGAGQPGSYGQQTGGAGQPGSYGQQTGGAGQPGSYGQQPGSYGSSAGSQYGQPYGQPGQSSSYASSPGQSPGQSAGQSGGHVDRPPQAYGQPGQPYGPPGSPPMYNQPNWGPPTAAQYGSDLRGAEHGYAQMYGQQPKTGLSTAAMVLGILAVIGSFIPLASYGAIVLAVLAVIFGLIRMRRQAGRGRAIAGLILGAIGLVASIWFSVIYTNYFFEVADAVIQCEEDTGRTSGPAFDRCVQQQAPTNPFSDDAGQQGNVTLRAIRS